MVPVYVMMPLNSVNDGNTVNTDVIKLSDLEKLKDGKVEGIMIDVWWGLVEREQPRVYNWGGYKELFEMANKVGLKVQAVMSFHQCGGNVGDDGVQIRLPKWVWEEMQINQDLGYTDQWGNRNFEYVSLGCDNLPVLNGRRPVHCYADFMRAFQYEFRHLLGYTIVEIQVGMGPAGELRYPSYPEQENMWTFPGIGAFQCFDQYMKSSFRAAAEDAGRPEWVTLPTDAGNYDERPESIPFFMDGWQTEDGKFFLTWYSEMLLRHGEQILSSAFEIFRDPDIKISVKIAGIHWHYETWSHAAELTAGYYNTVFQDGYLPIARMLARHGAIFNFTCTEMRDHELQHYNASCSPEKLVRQVVLAAQKANVPLAGENALIRYDEDAYNQIVQTSTLQVDENSVGRRMCAFTYLRLNPAWFDNEYHWTNFVAFVRRMNELN